MRVSVPVYVNQQAPDADGIGMYEVTPLFVEHQSVRDELLSRAMTRLAREIRKTLHALIRRGETEVLTSWTFCPEIEEHRYDIAVALRRRIAHCRFLVVAFKALDRTLAFSRCVPDVLFEVCHGESLRERATTVYTHHFRALERKSTEPIRPEDFGLPGKAYVLTLELDVHMPAVSATARTGDDSHFAAILSAERLSGAEELETAGECLDWLYPDELDRAIFRDEEVRELTRLLKEQDRRPVLFLGPRQSGKTAILHEYVFQEVDSRKNRFASRGNVWHLSPQRIISGMSVVGQWESRLLAIMEEAAKRDHVLYFDDLLGLYLAGLSAASTLSVAQVMKPHVEARKFRVLAESTPEAFLVLQERDRGLADLFHVVRISETTREQTIRIMIAAMRQHEGQNRCRFALDVLPTILELQGRYAHEAVFPGKAAAFARRLAARQRHDRVDRQHVLDEFHAVSGLSATFLDGHRKLNREDVEEGLRSGLVGQDPAVHAVTDSICRAKARLNDPDRPLGVFLFVGPTGVGKTQCAKAAATYLFGDPGRLLRFDMNEYVDAWSVARLVGTFDQPEGLLTSEVRRRPFCVLLLDEIEKAHPNVFDLLLQMLGEGRLTDALGRTTDFRNTLIILTSNLGAREARSHLGFREAGRREDEAYVDAVRGFFRPEFYNRLDKIVSFAPLTREEIGLIANRLIKEVMGRHGLRQRRCALHVDATAMDRMVEAGYHPRLGARALKRIVEQQLAQPVATCLAALLPGVPTVIKAYAGNAGIAVSAQGLENEARRDPPGILRARMDDAIARVDDFLARVDGRVQELRPLEPIRAGHILPEHQLYVALMEQARYARRLRNGMATRQSAARGPRLNYRLTAAQAFRSRRKRVHELTWKGMENRTLQELMAADGVKDALRDLEQTSVPDRDEETDELAELTAECALLEHMLRGRPDSRALLCCLSTDGATGRLSTTLREFYKPFFEGVWGYLFEELPQGRGVESEPIRDLAGWVVAGPGTAELARLEAGTQVLLHGEEIAVAVVRCVPLEPFDDPWSELLRESVNRKNWIKALSGNPATAPNDPYRCPPVLRVFEGSGTTLDFRTGLACTETPKGQLLRRMVLQSLPVPAELEADG